MGGERSRSKEASSPCHDDRCRRRRRRHGITHCKTSFFMCVVALLNLACLLPVSRALRTRSPSSCLLLTDCTDECGIEGILRKAEQYAGFANAGIADQ